MLIVKIFQLNKNRLLYFIAFFLNNLNFIAKYNYIIFDKKLLAII